MRGESDDTDSMRETRVHWWTGGVELEEGEILLGWKERV